MRYYNLLFRFFSSIRKFRAEVLNERYLNKKNGAALKKYLSGDWEKKLDLGTSESRLGFLTADLSTLSDISFDFTKEFPIQDNSFDFVYCSHVLEHFYYEELIFLLKEVKRILKEGGEFSICVPNARIFIEAYSSSQNFDMEKNCTHKPGLHYHSRIDIINYMAYMGGVHKMMYDENNLKGILEHTGFRNVTLRSYIEGLDLVDRKLESIYFACNK